MRESQKAISRRVWLIGAIVICPSLTPFFFWGFNHSKAVKVFGLWGRYCGGGGVPI